MSQASIVHAVLNYYCRLFDIFGRGVCRPSILRGKPRRGNQRGRGAIHEAKNNFHL